MSTPWTKALALPSDDEALSALVRVPPQPLKGVAGMNPVEAAETLEAALKTVYLASAQDLRLIRSIVALGAVHARTFYADTSQFIAKAKGKPNLPPDPPIRMLTFPLEVGNRWSTNTRVTGFAEGLAANFTETYDIEVDARGDVVTPYASFDALRVRVTLTRDLTFSRTVTRQFLFVAECFGTVATVLSEEDETQIEFDRAAEIRRLSF